MKEDELSRSKYSLEQAYTPEPYGVILTTHEFLRDLHFSVPRLHGGRVYTQVMVMFPDDVGRYITDIFKDIPNDNKKVAVIDAYSRLAANNGITFFDQNIQRWRKKDSAESVEKYLKMLQDLRDCGTEVDEINQPAGFKHKAMPFLDRNHIKATYVFDADSLQESVFYLHTSNHDDYPRIDMTVKFTGETALKLIEEVDRMRETPPQQDYERVISPTVKLYVDSGIPGKSIIRDQAVRLVKDAEDSINVITLMQPDGEFGNALERKYKSWKEDPDLQDRFDIMATGFHLEKEELVSINNVFAAVDQFSRIKSALKGSPLPIVYDLTRWAHAKFLLVDDKKLFIGSHNFAESGVKAGTREMQLLIKDGNIIQAAKRKFQDELHIARSTNPKFDENYLL